MAAQDGDPLHIVVFPWLAFGHLLPFLELSKSLARRGHRVSFITTPRNLSRLPTIPSDLSPFIDFVSFPLPPVDNLPADVESTSDFVHRDQLQFLLEALNGLRTPFSRFLSHQISSAARPDWIVLDLAQHWVLPVASEFKVPCVFFSIFPASTLAFEWGRLTADRDGGFSPEDLTVPPKWIPFPSNVAYRPFEARRMMRVFQKNALGVSLAKSSSSVVKGCSLIAVRSCSELEPVWFNLASDLYAKPLVPLGPLPPDGGHEEDAAGEEILEWLSKHAPQTVVFVAFGSEAMLSAEQQREMCLGLELSGVPFLWALRRPAEEAAELLEPAAVEKRTEGNGVIANGWVPQFKVLSHPSVGSFFTHCGCSSVIEGLQFGHPFVMLPLIADQSLIARRLEADELGVEVPRDENDGSFTREGVAMAVRKVMVEEKGEALRANAQKLREQAFSDKHRNESYIDDFVKMLRDYKEEIAIV